MILKLILLGSLLAWFGPWLQAQVFIQNKHQSCDFITSEGYVDPANDSLPVGLWKFYNAPDLLRTEGNYQAGKRMGSWKFYDSDGLLKQIIHYQLDTVEFYQEYFPHGALSFELKWESQSDTGQVVVYYENGLIRCRASVLHSSLDYYKVNRLNNNSYRLSVFDQNISKDLEGFILRLPTLHGSFIYYHEGNQKIQCKGNFKQGQQAGNWEYYYPSGQIALHCTFKQGWLSGPATSYFPTGLLASDLHFEMGMEAGGLCTTFSPHGQLQSQEELPPLDDNSIRYINQALHPPKIISFPTYDYRYRIAKRR